jgi:hypothetical protein
VELGEIEAQNGTDETDRVNFADRVARLEQIQDSAGAYPDQLGQAIEAHRTLLQGGAPLSSTSEDAVRLIMSLVQAHGPALGVGYEYGSDPLPALEAMAGLIPPPPPAPAGGGAPPAPVGPVGETYREADEDPDVPQVDPFVVDPAVRERGLRGHAMTQNALAGWVEAQGFEPKSPRPVDPNFDLAWEQGDRLYVAEVKSLTNVNEERQLRLGVGQVLRYRQVLGRHGRDVTAVLAVEQQPQDATWQELCEELQILLVWPQNMDDVLGDAGP